MKLSKKLIREMIEAELKTTLTRQLLREQEEEEPADEGGDEEAAGGDEDLFADEAEGGEEGAEVEGEEVGDEGGEAAGGGAGGGGGGGPAGGGGAAMAAGTEAAAAEQEQEVEVAISTSDEDTLGSSIDDTLEAVLIDFEAKAIKTAGVEDIQDVEFDEYTRDELATEWYKRSLSSLLFEQEEVDALAGVEMPNINLESFTADIARLVLNYDSLLDIEAIIINKAKEFLLSRYGQEHVDKFEEILDVRFDLAFKEDEADREQPLAIGSFGGGGGMGV